MATEVQTVGAGGEILLGLNHIGETVLIEEIEPGVWVVRSAPPGGHNELWLQTPAGKTSLDRALQWAGQNAAQESDLDSLEQKLLPSS